MFSALLGRKAEKEPETEQERELFRYIRAFRNLDNNVNQFFENYQNIPRSSGVMSTIWEAVMRTRTQMVNAISHMQDEERFMHGAFKEMRIQEMTQHITPLRQSVSRAVGILTLFNKNLTDRKVNSEEWFYEKSSFLTMLSESVCEAITNQSNAWRDFLLELYGVNEATKEAYIKHLDEENTRSMLKLKDLEARRCAEELSVYEKLYNKKYKSKGTREQLKFLVTVEDIYKLVQDTEVGYSFKKFAQEIKGNCGLQDNYTRRESFLALKDYQKGLTDLGPFGVSPLKNPKSYFTAETNAGEHPNGEKYLGYLELVHAPTRRHFTDVFGFRWYKCNMSTMTPISVSANGRGALSIPEGATQFCWVFPNIDDTIVAKETDEDKLDRINTYKKGTDAITCIMATGGFAYFDSKKRFLGVNGIYLFGDDMFFDGPYEFPKEKIKEYFSNEEEEAARMKDVTVPFLRDVFGCDKFGWIASDEDLEISNGAFYYLYDDEGKAPNYFKFLDFEQAKLKKLKNNNTPGIQYLDMLWDRFKDEWGQEDRIEDFRRALSRLDASYIG